MRPHSTRSQSQFGGRAELGQNFLHSPTAIHTIASLTRATSGPILEIGPGAGSLTAELYKLGRPLTLVELDETRLDHLEHSFPRAQLRHADALATRFDHPVVVGNLPFHLTTPILRRLLRARTWQSAILLTQWEVARKRAGVGGSTMMRAQWGPWFDFRLIDRVPAHAFTPKPSVDGGILTIERCPSGPIPDRHRSDYQQFVRSAFTGRGRGMKGILTTMSLTDRSSLHTTMDRNHVRGDDLPKDLEPQQWAGLYTALKADDSGAATPKKTPSAAHGQPTPTAKNPNSPKGKQKKRTGKGPTMRNDKGRPAEAAAESRKTSTGANGASGVLGPNTPSDGAKKAEARGSGAPAPGALGAIPAVTGEIPVVAEKPVITGELPIIGADQAAKKREAPIPGVDVKGRAHDKGHIQAERGFMPQHKKAQQPQPKWNLPRRQG